MTRPDRPSDEELTAFMREKFPTTTKELIRAALAKWGQPAPQVEASATLAGEFDATLATAERMKDALARFAPPAPCDAAKVEALIEVGKRLRDQSKVRDCDWTDVREFDAALAALRASRPVERRVGGWAVLNHNGTVCMVYMDKSDAEWLTNGHPLKPMGEGARVVPCTITLHDAEREEEEG